MSSQQNTTNNSKNETKDVKNTTNNEDLAAQQVRRDKQSKQLSILTVLVIAMFVLSVALFVVGIVLAQQQQKLHDSFEFNQQENGDLDFKYNEKEYRIPVKQQGANVVKSNLTSLPQDTLKPSI